MFQEIKPGGWESQYVESYWMHTNTSADVIKTTVLPDGCSDIILSFEDGACTPLAVGCMSRVIRTSSRPSQLMCGIRFKPGLAWGFFKISMADLTDKIRPLDDLVKLDAEALCFEMITDSSKAPSVLRKSLVKLLGGKQIDKTAHRAAEYIKHNRGMVSIDEVANFMNVSRRHLERRFKEAIGLSPKRYSRIMRLRSVRSIMKASPARSLAAMAAQAGYFDQAHLCRDYKELFGKSPAGRNRSHFSNTLQPES